MDHQLFYSSTAGGFLDSRIHKDLPPDAVPISASAHAALLAGQRGGRPILPDDRGHPHNVTPAAPSLTDRREAMTSAIKAEARRRILAVASLERQANDSAAIAGAAMQLATGAAGVDLTNAHDAAARRAAIDAIRAASDRFEAQIATSGARALAHIDVAASTHWPL